MMRINDEAEYRAVLARVEAIFDAEPGTTQGDELDALLRCLEAYEEETYPIDDPSPHET